MNISPQFHQRWAAIFIKKWDHESQNAALEWARRTVPKSEAIAVKDEVRKIREAQEKGQGPKSAG